jgi:hypothetical protein
MGAAPLPNASEVLRSLLPACHRASVSKEIGQLVGQRWTKDRQNRLMRGGGQGRDRTVDLPIFRTPAQCPPPAGTVRDLRQNSLVVAGGRPRTNANETEIETTAP